MQILDNSPEAVYCEASINDSFVYTALNNSSQTTTTIVKALKTGVEVEKSYIEEQLMQIKRSRVSPLVEAILNAYENKQIRFFYNKQVRVSTSLPFIVLTVGGRTSSFIFLSDFCALRKDGNTLNIEMKKLYCLMEAAYVGFMFYSKPELFKRSSGLMKIVANIYSSMCMKIFNKEYALSLDKDLFDKVQYITARFELERMSLLNNNELIHSYAASTCLNPSQINLKLAASDYINESIVTIEDLSNYLKSISPKMGGLTFRYLFERWVSTYGTGAALSIDAFPYLYYVIINGLLGGFLINVQIMSDIIKNTKGINIFYSEMSKIVR